MVSIPRSHVVFATVILLITLPFAVESRSAQQVARTPITCPSGTQIVVYHGSTPNVAEYECQALPAASPSPSASVAPSSPPTAPPLPPTSTPTVAPTATPAPTAAPSRAPQALHVEGTRLVANGQDVILRGVSRSGMEYACAQGWGMADGPMDAASVDAITGWGVNLVRLPLNESCWLGINGVNATYAGANYQTAVKNYVNLVTARGMYVLLDLHWSAPGTYKATGQQPMADADHSIDFWKSVATTFATNDKTIFQLFNEPFVGNGTPTDADWQVWRNGGTVQTVATSTNVPAGGGYQAAGMQQLIDAVRSTGAQNVVLVGGLVWAGTLDKFLANAPTDPAGNMAVGWHMYDDGGSRATQAYWDTTLASVAAQFPLVADEIGEKDRNADHFVHPFMDYSDAHGFDGYAVWAWDTWGQLGTQPDGSPIYLNLVTDYAGTPSQTYGATVRDHLLGHPKASATPSPSVAASPSPSVPPTATSVPPMATSVPPTATPLPPTATPSPTPPVSASPVVIAGAGDIAYSGTTGDDATAALLQQINPSVVFNLGDNAYYEGTATQFTNYYDPSWGKLKAKTKPVAGNHEYNSTGAAGYYGYFGDVATPLEPGCRSGCKGYYSYDLPNNWHVVVVNSGPTTGTTTNNQAYVAATSAQYAWVKADLQANAGKNVIAMMHHPRFSSGSEHGNNAFMNDLWNLFVANNVDLVLAGHDHDYERFSPMGADGVLNYNATREIVVGTGGMSHYGVGTRKANSDVFNGDTFGVLKLSLYPDRYDWQFVPEAGKTFTDSGSTAVH